MENMYFWLSVHNFVQKSFNNRKPEDFLSIKLSFPLEIFETPSVSLLVASFGQKIIKTAARMSNVLISVKGEKKIFCL